MAKRHNFDLDQGSTKVFSVRYRVKNTGEPIDLTGWTTRMDVRTDFLDNQPVPEFTLTEGDGLDMSEASDGRVIITISKVRSGALSAKSYRYDLEVEDGSGIVKRLVGGLIDVKPQVTD